MANILQACRKVYWNICCSCACSGKDESNRRGKPNSAVTTWSVSIQSEPNLADSFRKNKKAGVLFLKLRPCKSIFSIGIINKIVHEFLWTIFGRYFASLTRKFFKKANHFCGSSLLRVKLRFKSGRSVRKIYGKKEKIRASKMPGNSWCVRLCARRIYTALIRCCRSTL